MTGCLSPCPLFSSLPYKHLIPFKSPISLPLPLAYANGESVLLLGESVWKLKRHSCDDRMGSVPPAETTRLWDIWNGTVSVGLGVGILSLVVAPKKTIAKYTVPDTPLWKLFLCFMKNDFEVTCLYYFTPKIHWESFLCHFGKFLKAFVEVLICWRRVIWSI